VLGRIDPDVLDGATEPHVIAKIFRAVGVAEQIIYVRLANLEMTGGIATVVRLVAFGHLEGSSFAVCDAPVNGKARARIHWRTQYFSEPEFTIP
jgi:hypothetical protein